MARKQKLNNLDTEEKLLLVGLEHFLKTGGGSLSVRKVAQEAGVNLGSFVYHFKTKDIFIAKIFERQYLEFMSQFIQALSEVDQNEGPVEALRKLISVMSEFVVKNHEFFARVCMDIFAGEKAVLALFMKEPPPHFSVMLGLIKRGQDQGLLRKDMTPTQLVLTNIFTVGMPYILGLQAASHLKNSAGKMLKDQITDPGFLNKRIDFIMRGMMSEHPKSPKEASRR